MDTLGDRQPYLPLSGQTNNPNFLSSLEHWQELGLITPEHLRDFCARHLSCPLYLWLPASPQHPNLLQGLDQWITQGFIHEQTITTWCQQNLCEPLPEVPQRRQQKHQPTPSPKHHLLPTLLQSLMDEMSVLWLLFLGVFLVVVSSAILAASQWNQVPPAGQYGILWGYTFAMWVISHWLERRSDLQLTAHTLQITALLIIPVNFWMIDAFHLIQSGISLAVALIAGIILSGLMAYTLKPQNRDRWHTQTRGWLIWVNLLLVSWLHWGWDKTNLPPIAIYIGILTTGFCTVYLHTHPPETVQARPPNRYPFVELLAFTPLYGTLLLLLRGIWIAQIPLENLGLAFGLLGALFCWTGHRPILGASSWWLAGIISLLGGRIIASDHASQALAITLLGLWALGDRLRRSWQPWLIWLMFITGLQGLFPLYASVPEPIQDIVLTQVKAIAGNNYQPAWMSLLGLPYLWIILWGNERLRQVRPQLVPLLERLVLGLGNLLTLLSLWNPVLRSIFLISLTGTLLWRSHRPNVSPFLLGLTHTLGLGAIASLIHTLRPDLRIEQWGILCLIGMLGEFGLALRPSRWQRSCWGLGLTLASIGYLCFLEQSPYAALAPSTGIPLTTSFTWLIPLAFTGIGLTPQLPQRKTAQICSLFSIFAVLLLCWPFTLPRSIGCGVGMLLMGTTAWKMRRSQPVILTVGLGALSIINGFWSYIPPSAQDWMWVVIPSISLGFSAIAGYLHSKRWSLGILYSRACRGWSQGVNLISTLALGILLIVKLTNPPEFLSLTLPTHLGAGLVGLATLSQLLLFPTAWNGYSFALALETFLGLLATLSPWPYDLLSPVTLAIGGIVSLKSIWQPPIAPKHQTILPLLFAVFGWLIGHHAFQSHTGLYTIGAAWLFLIIGRRQERYRGLTYLGVAALSFGVYELLVYQLLQAKGEYAGDALILFAGLATLITWSDRLLARWSDRLLRLPYQQFLTIAHLHWLFGSLFLMTALLAPMRPWAEISWIILTLLLSRYALSAGKRQSGFIDFGIGQGLSAIAFSLAQIISLSILQKWGGAIAVSCAAGLYYFPWQKFRWPQQAGNRMAMIVPAGVIVLTLPQVGLSSLLVSGAWYFWISQKPNLQRLSYLGLALGNWAILLLIDRWFEITPLWLAILIGSSILLIVQWEPILQTPEQREVKHWLRCLALGLIALIALYESEDHFIGSLVTVIAGLLIGSIGIGLRIRAFLYIGTALFLIKVLWMLWAFVTDHAFLLWAFGIVLGIILIWIAATFESRRTQAIALMDYWIDAIEDWQ